MQFLLNEGLYEGSPAYCIESFMKVDGDLDESRLRNAWERVFAAMRILRCGVGAVDGRPVFVEHAECGAPWSVIACDAAAAKEHAAEVSDSPFDLASPPLARFIIYRTSASRRYLLIVLHHIVCDLHTLELLATSLARAYSDPSFVPSFVPYEQFVTAEQEFLAGAAGAKAREYWAGRMRSGFETLRLPQASNRPQPFAGTGQRSPWHLSGEAAAALIERERAGASPFLTLLTAYASFLSRISNQRHFCIGVPLTNRSIAPDPGIAGACVNILPVLVRIDRGDTYSTVYDRLRREMLLNHRHQAFPFVEIASLYAGERNPLRPRLVQAGFMSAPPVKLVIDGLACEPIQLPRSGAQMDLSVTWWRDEDRWQGYWEYNDASFSAPEITLWQAAFERILLAGLRDPHCVVERIRLADRPMIESRSGPDRLDRYPLGESVAHHLRESISGYHDMPALVFGETAVTYRELARRIGRVASSIHSAVGSRGRVVLLFDRSPAMVYAVHGTVLSGNAYVPIGVDWPADRIAEILDDVEPSLVLTEERHRPRFDRTVCPVITMERLLDDRSRSDESPHVPTIGIVPEDPLSILYTSGTSGKPKGVVVPHVAIANHLFWLQERFAMRPDERCLLKTPYTFDVSVWELFWPFIAGACLVIADESQHRDPREILDLAVVNRVTRLNFVPTLLDHFLRQPGLDALTDLTDVQSIGETLPVELLQRFQQHLPHVRLHNLYGPTEASVSVTHWECGEADIARGTVPIGRPMANTSVYIVDEAMQLCPPLVRGEILLGGTCLATGYWNRDEVTKERFVPNPFGSGRLYRTGDWGRYGIDGVLECFDRKDTQTKIRGVRIELAEIETHLRRVAGIEAAAVIKGRDPSGTECLIAYYTRSPGASVDPKQIRWELRRRLPAAVVPDHLVARDSFPMNGSGKLDRDALPDRVVPAAVERAADHGMTHAEAVVASLWDSCLGLPCPDVNLSFFDAGGNSMTLLALRSALEQAFGSTVSIARLFQVPTISGMASLFDGGAAGAAAAAGDPTRMRAARRRDMVRAFSARRRRPG